MNYSADDHTFVICAYKESIYLEECILSLKKQTLQSSIIISTSTQCEYIQRMADKYQIPLYINTKRAGEIADDWNYGYLRAETSVVTIAHQDDIYLPTYTEEVIRNLNRCKRPIIAFTDYAEIRDNVVIKNNHLLKIKRIMLSPLRYSVLWKSRLIRRRILAFGSAICCPSVTYIKEQLPETVFEPGYRSCVDWQAWEKLSKYKGEFVYCNQVLMCHRIHQESATTAIIQDHDRTKEDYDMFCRFWPKPLAYIIEMLYQKSERSNEINF